MSIAEGRAYFRELGLEDRVMEFNVSSATVDLAAAAVGVEGARIAKTLSFKTPEGCMLILAAGDARIDNHKFKEKFHYKAKMLSADEVMELVGHPVGGVCPFGIKPGIPVYLDISLKREHLIKTDIHYRDSRGHCSQQHYGSLFIGNRIVSFYFGKLILTSLLI